MNPIDPSANSSSASNSPTLLHPALHISRHPLVRHKLGHLRGTATSSPVFRALVRELAALLAYEATADLALRPVQVTTPMSATTGEEMAESVALVPVLRAGLGMVEGAWQLIPNAPVWHLGLFRNEETLAPVSYYNKLPLELTAAVCLLLDPMLATGGSAIAAASMLKAAGARRIKYVGIIGAPEGVRRMAEVHPDIAVHLGALDERLNDVGYIVPGLGDAGDRMFGTR